MILTIEQLVDRIVPSNTTLFFGAGASIPSGAPSVTQLLERMARHYKIDAAGMSLMELASYIEITTRDRRALIQHLRASFTGKKPTGGMLTVPHFDWKSIYTTNYDTLIEDAFDAKERSLKPYLSNYDFDGDDGTSQKLYKLHGSIQHDRTDGHKASLVLTQADYDAASQYREFLYNRLKVDIAESTLLVVGYSLSDEAIRDLIAKIAELKSGIGLGRCAFLMYERDERRAQLLDAKNFDVAFGGIDALFASLLQKTTLPIVPTAPAGSPLSVAPALIAATTDVAHACKSVSSNASAIFNGQPASFSDIYDRLTFSRDVVNEIQNVLTDARPIAILLGASGVGKTTAARQFLLHVAQEKSWLAWEHRGDQVLLPHYWLAVAKHLVSNEMVGVLLVDDAHQHLQQINEMVDSLPVGRSFGLRIILTSSRNAWSPRVKSPVIYRSGTEIRMQRLSNMEIERLLTLVDTQPRISALVENSFAGFSRQERKRRLQERCDSETFVCLRNVFATEGFDAIILREFASLPEEAREVYRNVAFLETSGVRVHRQLLIRLLGISASSVAALLARLADVVSEYEIDKKEGIYGWRGRHPVITGIVTRYKFANQTEIVRALSGVIGCINPAFGIEVRSLRELCSIDTGVSRIADLGEQNRLLRQMISIAPSERVPRHRLIRNLISLGEYDQAATEIRIFTKDLRKDGPTARYEIELIVARAVRTPGLMDEDKRVLLADALALTQVAVGRFPYHKGVLKAFCELGLAKFRLFGEIETFDAALDAVRAAENEAGDPEIGKMLTRYENRISAGRDDRDDGDDS